MTNTPDYSTKLTDVTPYVYGTTRLGDANIPFDDRVRLARKAMDAGVWFHTSHQYGNALEVLRAAFDQDRGRVPKLIVKIGWNNIAELRQTIQTHLDALAVDSLELGQLCLGGALAEEFASGGPCYREFEQIKAERMVRRFVVEVFPWTSEMSYRAIRGGYPHGVVDGYIFYLNPLQRFASNPLWELLEKERLPMVAMRTVAGGDVHKLRDVPGYAWKPYLQERAAEVAPIFERSGVPTWMEFCVRFAHSFPLVRATVGASGREENLRAFLDAAKKIEPLPQEIVDEIRALHTRWSEELDVHAEMWSM